ncbi:glutathione S-transferase family protein [Oxalobacteraceae bacterium A2-2]
MLTLLGKSSSINVRKVLWTLDEIGLAYRQEQYGAGFQPTDTPDFLARNPNGLVPVLVDGDAVLWESNTICRYLAGRHGRSDLLPADPLARAQVEKWMDWQATELNNSWRYAFMALVRNSPSHTDEAAIEASVREWNRQMTLLERRLQHTGGYVEGDTLTLADIVLGLSANRWLLAPIAHAALPAVEAYLDRLAQRPAFLAHGRNGLV